jgi:hypothetical protein
MLEKGFERESLIVYLSKSCTSIYLIKSQKYNVFFYCLLFIHPHACMHACMHACSDRVQYKVQYKLQVRA